jgi:YD repeat-containing protein
VTADIAGTEEKTKMLKRALVAAVCLGVGSAVGCAESPVDLGHDDATHGTAEPPSGSSSVAGAPAASAEEGGTLQGSEDAGATTDLEGGSAGTDPSQSHTTTPGGATASTGGSGGIESSGGSAGTDSSGGRGGIESDAGSAGIESSGGSGGIEPSGGSGGIEPPACDAIPGPCTRARYSSDVDSLTTTYYFYDAAGQLVREEVGAPPDAITRYTYDDEGRLLESRTDSCDESGLPPDCLWTIYTYDEQGNLVLRDNRDGTPNAKAGCTYYTYTDDGQVLSSEYYYWCSDILYESVTYEYDAAGLLMSMHQENTQAPSADFTITYEYDAAGRVVTERRTYPSNPESDMTKTYEYDTAGQVITETFFDADGNVTLTILYTRNAAGQPLTEERQYPDEDDYQIVNTYDGQGNELTQHMLYLEGESAGARSMCWVRTFDDCGNPLTEDYDLDCDEPASYQTTWSYDCFGG